MTTPSIPGYTEAELESLTPEELSALESDSGDNEQELTEIANEDGEDGKADEKADDKAGEDNAKGDESKGDGNDDDTKTGDEAADEADDKAPLYTAETPKDITEQMAVQKQAKTDAKTQEKEALKKLHDGEIDFEEYDRIKAEADTAIDAADEKIGDLRDAMNRSKVAEEMTQQESARAWAAEVGNLMGTAKTIGLDYKGNAELNKELNGLVRAFGAEATANGMSDVGLKASKWALQQAHDVMKVRHADKLVKPAVKPGEKESGKPRHDLTALNNMPNADRAMGDNDQIVKLGELDGEDLERAMAKMSPAEIEKLMAST